MTPPTLSETTPGRDLKHRFVWLGLAMVLALGLLSIQLYRLQITQGEEYAAKSVANFVKEVRLRADRGLIKDERGTILVDSRPSFDAFITPAFCTNCAEEVLPRLGELLGWDEASRKRVEEQVKLARRAAPFVPIPVRVDLSRDEYDRINARRDMLDGVEVVPVPHRNYRTTSVLSHVLGYMNEINPDELERLDSEGAHYALGDYIGRRGLERSFESTLRGKDGKRKEVVNARGKVLEEFSDKLGPDAVEPGRPGNNLVLSLDMRLQEEAERVFPGSAGAMVVVDVRTGFIRALVSRPGFDPNLLTGRITPAQMASLARDPLQPMINRVSANHFSPGSTFKVISTLAAYKSGLFKPETTVMCTGSYRLGARAWRCHKDSGHGPVNGNDGAAVLVRHRASTRWRTRSGWTRSPTWARRWAWGRPRASACSPRCRGSCPSSAYHDRVSPGGYTKGMALNSASGQGDDNVTPLQLAHGVRGDRQRRARCTSRSWCARVEGLDGEVHRGVRAAGGAQGGDPRGAPQGGDGRAGGGGERARRHGLPHAAHGRGGGGQDGHRAGGGASARCGSRSTRWTTSSATTRGSPAFAPADDSGDRRGGAQRARRPRWRGRRSGGMAVIQKYFDLKKEDAAPARRRAPEPRPTSPARCPSTRAATDDAAAHAAGRGARRGSGGADATAH